MAKNDAEKIEVNITSMPSDFVMRTASASFTVNGGAGGSVSVHLQNMEPGIDPRAKICEVLRGALDAIA